MCRTATLRGPERWDGKETPVLELRLMPSSHQLPLALPLKRVHAFVPLDAGAARTSCPWTREMAEAAMAHPDAGAARTSCQLTREEVETVLMPLDAGAARTSCLWMREMAEAAMSHPDAAAARTSCRP